MNRNRLINDILLKVKNHSSEILTLLGCCGVVGTAVIAVDQNKKAEKEISQLPSDKTKLEIYLVYLKFHVPTALTGIGTMVCVISANKTSAIKENGLISAYGLLNESFSRYRNKVIEHHGVEEHRKILNEMSIEHAEPTYIHSTGAFYSPSLCASELSKDDKIYLFHDMYSDRYFESTLARVMDAEFNVNRNFCLGEVVLINEWYEFLGLEQSIEGNEVGWYLGNEDEYYWLDFNHSLTTMEDGTEIVDIEMMISPSIKWQEEF